MKNIYLSDLKIALKLAMRRARKENDEVAQGVHDAAICLAEQLAMTDTEVAAFMASIERSL